MQLCRSINGLSKMVRVQKGKQEALGLDVLITWRWLTFKTDLLFLCRRNIAPPFIKAIYMSFLLGNLNYPTLWQIRKNKLETA